MPEDNREAVLAASGEAILGLESVPRVAVNEQLKPSFFGIPKHGDDKVPVLVLPEGFTLHGVQSHIDAFEKTQDAPYRRRGTYVAADIASLVAWMEAHTDDSAPVFGSGLESLNGQWRNPKLALIGIGNYSDGKENPDWHDFRTRYDFPVSDAWKTWASAHSEPGAEKWMPQPDFAEFIEDRLHDISSPLRNEELSEAVTRFLEANKGVDAASPTRLFELSRGLKVMSESKVEMKVNLQSGETEMQYSEEHTGTGGRPLKIPGLFYIRIPVFFGQAPTLIGVRLRYRAGGGIVKWSCALFAPDMIVADEFKKACEFARVANRTVYLGTPDQP